MSEFTRRIRFPHPISSRSLGALLLAAVLAATAVAVLGPARHAGSRSPALLAPTRSRGGARNAAARTGGSGAAPAQSTRGACGEGATGSPARPADPALTRRLDSILDAMRKRTAAPAATAAVVVCGRVLWAGASGVLAVDSHRPVNDGTLFIINSAVKPFVATMVMREIQAGRLSLDSRLSQFYPQLPGARRITVRMLLDMRSGLPDYLSNPRVKSMILHHPRHHWTIDEVLSGLGTGLGALDFPPGSRFQYSDTDYIALGGILTRITHRSIQQDFEQLIARPAGITTGTFIPSATAAARMAHPYVLARDGRLSSGWIPGFGVASVVWGPVFTDGGLALSTPDLARFGNALFGDRLLDATGVRQMTRIGPGDYGLGIRERTFDGRRWLGHRGYFAGFEAEQWSDPSRQVTIATATDLQTPSPSEPTCTRIWTAIARAYDAGSR
jgi:D-alanyl-D-alanine carboxypeptidase